MSLFRFLLTIGLVVLPLPLAATTVPLGDNATIPLPSGWSLVTDNDEYPFQIAADNLGAELLIFEHELTGPDRVNDESDLKAAVDNVLADVIPFLPESQILANTGFSEGDRAGFILDFVATDTTLGVQLRHRLESLIYRRPDGGQLMFTLWAKSAYSRYADFAEDIQRMQDGFTYHGPRNESVFSGSQYTVWYVIVALFLIVGLLYYFRASRLRSGEVNFRESENHWRCDCGRLNHVESDHCRRCGQSRQTAETT
jgi:hypothetical protein